MDKTTNLMPAMILPSIRFTKDDVDQFGEDGIYQKAYDNFREYCLRNNPSLNFVGEKIVNK